MPTSLMKTYPRAIASTLYATRRQSAGAASGYSAPSSVASRERAPAYAATTISRISGRPRAGIDEGERNGVLDAGRGELAEQIVHGVCERAHLGRQNGGIGCRGRGIRGVLVSEVELARGGHEDLVPVAGEVADVTARHSGFFGDAIQGGPRDAVGADAVDRRHQDLAPALGGDGRSAHVRSRNLFVSRT